MDNMDDKIYSEENITGSNTNERPNQNNLQGSYEESNNFSVDSNADAHSEDIVIDEPKIGVYDNFEAQQDNAEQKGGHINIQNVKVKRNRFKKIAPYIATILISAIVGGVAGGEYVNYLLTKDKPYFPITSTQENSSTNTVGYTQPTSLIAQIAAAVGPAVVGVDTQTVTQGFFGQRQMSQGSGSGIIFDKNGYIVTNQHVINGSQKITVTLPGGKTFTAKVIGQDPISDIAVLKINATNLPVAKFGDSSKVRVGDLAVAIGNPMGEEYAGSVTSGIISALNRTINLNDGGYSRRYKLIQTDAAINPGNSGGALINSSGEVIGINSIKFADSSIEGMGFAIPINDVKNIINELMTHGYVSHPYMGVSVITIDEQMAKEYNTPTGVGVNSVVAGSAAEAAGLKPGDVILEIDGVKLTTNDDLINELMKHKAGDTVKLKVWRDGSNMTISVTLGENKGTSN